MSCHVQTWEYHWRTITNPAQVWVWVGWGQVGNPVRQQQTGWQSLSPVVCLPVCPVLSVPVWGNGTGQVGQKNNVWWQVTGWGGKVGWAWAESLCRPQYSPVVVLFRLVSSIHVPEQQLGMSVCRSRPVLSSVKVRNPGPCPNHVQGVGTNLSKGGNCGQGMGNCKGEGHNWHNGNRDNPGAVWGCGVRVQQGVITARIA